MTYSDANESDEGMIVPRWTDAGKAYADSQYARGRGLSVTYAEGVADAYDSGLIAGAASVTPPCLCYPGGFTPENYEGPQADCPVHGGPSGIVFCAPERTLTADEADARPKNSLFFDRAGDVWRRNHLASQFSPRDEPYRLVYDPTWQPAPPVPAPVLLTADDPRWRDGAKVRGEFPDGSAVEGTAEALDTLYVSGNGSHLRFSRFRFAEVHLLADAPDPDTDLVDVLQSALDPDFGYWTWRGVRELLKAIRSSGYEITKAAEA